MPSPYPLEYELGMRYYASDVPGIGGRLRSVPEDFVVSEVSFPAGQEGAYLICRLTKKNWELQRAVKEIARQLGISHRRIAWAGTKDKNAVTSQAISIYNVPPEAIEQVRLKDITLTVIGRSHTPLTLGSLEANRFEIVIRDCSLDLLQERVRAVEGIAVQGIPNYYGLQRFGVARPVTHLVGEQILREEYESAVALYIGLSFPDEPPEARAARDTYLTSRDARRALHELPVQMTYERSMLHHLAVHPGDYRGALLVLPQKLLSLFVSAFQSFLFNCALSRRFDLGLPLNEPEIGDRLLFSGGREDIVTARNRTAALQQVTRGRCRIALFIPGSEPIKVHGMMDEAMQHLMEERGIDASRFQNASEFVRTRYSGALRPIALQTAIQSSIEERDVRLQFSLPPGHYATTVCREFMKADPRMMV